MTWNNGQKCWDIQPTATRPSGHQPTSSGHQAHTSGLQTLGNIFYNDFPTERRHRNYTATQDHIALETAIQLVLVHGQPLRRVARDCNIPFTTLWRNVNKRKGTKVKYE